MALVARALTTTCRLEHMFHILIGVFVLVLLHCTIEADASYQARNSAASGYYTADTEKVYEKGFLVETVFDGNKPGLPHVHSISTYIGTDLNMVKSVVALDSTRSNIVRILLPLSLSSVSQVLSGSPNGETGYRDGRLDEALFHNPKSFTTDDAGNIYVADPRNIALRKVSDVTTIAGGSNMTGRRDGEGKEASFSNDFDVIYMRSSCCLLIADRGNRMIREIQLPRVGGSCPGNSGSKLGDSPIFLVALVLVGFVVGGLLTTLAFRWESLVGKWQSSTVPQSLMTTSPFVVPALNKDRQMILPNPEIQQHQTEQASALQASSVGISDLMDFSDDLSQTSYGLASNNMEDEARLEIVESPAGIDSKMKEELEKFRDNHKVPTFSS
ncbi:unnamed protein product [Sphagnum jensenii]|uniref:NHL repeat-containing protein n=1 Tax=Sphagnum jensenii TaxID=128206 RepID=A0ABP0WAL0_9BRYO